MVVVLKDVSIRGDFRTTVEYLIKLLETQAFEENSITTRWLDMLVSDENLTAEKPDKMLAVICGAVASYSIPFSRYKTHIISRSAYLCATIAFHHIATFSYNYFYCNTMKSILVKCYE